MKEKFVTQWTQEYSEQIKMRLKKRTDIESNFKSAYKNNYRPNITGQAIHDKFGEMPKEEIGETPLYDLCGRVLLMRDFGKASFLTLDDGTKPIQIYVKKGDVDDSSFEEFKLLDYGDILFVSGQAFKTNKGELTIHAKKTVLLTKSIRPLPEKFHGLTDPELCYRMRYVDLIMNREVRERLKLRSNIVRFIREYFYKKDFLEVETPMMHSVAGGATAKPFKTHHNALDMELFLRIAPELHLKRLIVGGFPKVFEMNRCFRNEGLSIKHNPEFTSIEFYEAYATYEDLMNLTEDLLRSLTKTVIGKEIITYQDKEIHFDKKFRRLTLDQSICEYVNLSLADLQNKDKLKALLKDTDIPPKNYMNISIDRLKVLVFEEYVESKLIQPTFITEYPTEISPLSRRNDDNPKIVDRFELFINGWEVANAFSELNNPTDQLERFAEQAELKLSGDEEASDVDYDFVRALEYGMPPTAGEGIGIDRLCMILTDATSIRDVIAFPLLKKETFFE